MNSIAGMIPMEVRNEYACHLATNICTKALVFKVKTAEILSRNSPYG